MWNTSLIQYNVHSNIEHVELLSIKYVNDKSDLVDIDHDESCDYWISDN